MKYIVIDLSNHVPPAVISEDQLEKLFFSVDDVSEDEETIKQWADYAEPGEVWRTWNMEIMCVED